MSQLATVLAILAIVGTGQFQMPLVLQIDPEAENVLELQEPAGVGGTVRTSHLVGGIATTLTFDARRLLSRDGVMATVRVDDVRIAGTGFDILGLIPTGTLCVSQDPELPSGGVAFLRPVRGTASMQVTLATLSFATNPALAGLIPPIPLGATLEDEFPLSLVQLLALLLGEERVIYTTQSFEDALPEEIPVLGGSAVMVTTSLYNADMIAPDPLLDECDAFLGTE
jgi:hypothetical protein